MGCIYLFPFIYTYGLLIGIRAVCFHQFHCFIDSFRPAHAKSISHSRQLCAGSTSSARGMRWRSADSRWLSLRAWRPGWRFKGFSWRRSWSSWAARSRRLDSSWTQMPTWSRPTRAMYVVSGSLQLCASFYSSCRDLRNPSARLEKKKKICTPEEDVLRMGMDSLEFLHWQPSESTNLKGSRHSCKHEYELKNVVVDIMAVLCCGLTPFQEKWVGFGWCHSTQTLLRFLHLNNRGREGEMENVFQSTGRFLFSLFCPLP